MDTPENKNPNVVVVELKFDLLTGEFSITGCDQNPVVALGMFDYATSRIRRALVTNDMQHMMDKAYRIVPGSPFRQ